MSVRGVKWLVVAAALVAAPSLAFAQGVGGDIAGRLTARGLPADLVQQIQGVATQAAAQGVPSTPLADKAIEGWAKHVPADRIVAAVRAFADRMTQAGAALHGAGVQVPSGTVIAAAADAMGGGLKAGQVGTIVRAAASADAAAPMLSVAASLAAQGISGKQAVTIVVDAMRRGRSMSQLLDLPSVARSMHDQGMSPSEIGDRLLPHHGDDEGGGVGDGDHRGGKDRPPVVPPNPENPDHP